MGKITQKQFEDREKNSIAERWKRIQILQDIEKKNNLLHHSWGVGVKPADTYYAEATHCFSFGQYRATITIIGSAIESLLAERVDFTIFEEKLINWKKSELKKRGITGKNPEDLIKPHKDLVLWFIINEAKENSYISENLAKRLNFFREFIRNPIVHVRAIMPYLGMKTTKYSGEGTDKRQSSHETNEKAEIYNYKQAAELGIDLFLRTMSELLHTN